MKTDTAFKGRGVLASPLAEGPAEIEVTEDSLRIRADRGWAAEVTYAEMMSIELKDHAVCIGIPGGGMTLARLGLDTENFFRRLCGAYDAKVKKALFVKGNPVLITNGSFSYSEDGLTVSGKAPFEVYGECVLILPPDLNARRVPLCFVKNVTSADYEAAITLDTGERYVFSKMGYDTEPFVKAVRTGVSAMRMETVGSVRDIDPASSFMQAQALADLLHGGAAVPIGTLRAASPSFVRSFEKIVSSGRAALAYPALVEMCGEDRVSVGFWKRSMRDTAEEDGCALLPKAADPQALKTPPTAETAAEITGYDFWILASSPDGRIVALEFAGDSDEAAATYIYETDSGPDAFRLKLGRALEAFGFRRDPIRLSDEELIRSVYIDIRMAADRNAALRSVRRSFAGRVIHRSPEWWAEKVSEYIGPR